jgi:hypothetical protein
MKNRFYIDNKAEKSLDFNYVITPQGQEIKYSFLYTKEEHNPPKEYRLVYETDDDDYSIICDPFGVDDFD